jgi:DnaJ like chaperone protein
MKYGKWIGGTLGWALSGGSPIGAILGFAMGSMVDHTSTDSLFTNSKPDPSKNKQPGDFMTSLLILTACVMKADGKVMRSELDYVKQFFAKQFGEQFTLKQMHLLREILQKEIPVQKVCEDIRQYMEQPARLQLMHYLYGIAAADGHFHPREVELLNRISIYLGIHPRDSESLKSMFINDASGSGSYSILEITPEADIEEIKKAYRRMATKYHPDKVSHLGEEHQHAAKEKFQKVQEAYEKIRKQRGF